MLTALAAVVTRGRLLAAYLAGAPEICHLPVPLPAALCCTQLADGQHANVCGNSLSVLPAQVQSAAKNPQSEPLQSTYIDRGVLLLKLSTVASLCCTHCALHREQVANLHTSAWSTILQVC
jgi:hypothetical protein